MRPTVDHHNGVEGHADHRPALDDRFDLLVCELPVPVSQRAAVVMAGPQRPGVAPQRILETLVAEMGHIQNDSQPLHLFEQFAALFAVSSPWSSVPCRTRQDYSGPARAQSSHPPATSPDAANSESSPPLPSSEGSRWAG